VGADFIVVDAEFGFSVGFHSVLQGVNNVVAGDVMDSVVFPDG